MPSLSLSIGEVYVTLNVKLTKLTNKVQIKRKSLCKGTAIKK